MIFRTILSIKLCLITGFFCGLSAQVQEEAVQDSINALEGSGLFSYNTTPNDKQKVYIFPIREDIMPSAVRLTSKCLAEATEMEADLVIINMNTYGGLLDAADSIRTSILNYEKPVYVFINNQAASAGALIAIAADRIYMRDGASIGAATVVTGDGSALPDKYQSFMRSMMRSTAESHGKYPEIHGRDTVWKWYRDPAIAEAMVDPSIEIPGLISDTKVLTFSTEEAIRWHYCEGRASSVEDVLRLAEIRDYELYEYHPTALDKLVGFLTNPVFQGIMIMLIIGGIYFELQTPGVGFPLAVSILGALLYFSPLYIEGLASHWELIIFIAGIILILVEVFATPGFGVLGMAGIVAVIVGLAFALIEVDLLKHIPSGQIPLSYAVRPLGLVIIAVSGSLILSIWLGKRFLTTDSVFRKRVVLTSSMEADQGYVSHMKNDMMVGMEGYAATDMCPAGKVMVDGSLYAATTDNGMFIPKGSRIVVVRYEGGVLYCRNIISE